jgi:hypothetical protein
MALLFNRMTRICLRMACCWHWYVRACYLACMLLLPLVCESILLLLSCWFYKHASSGYKPTESAKGPCTSN